ncbi:MAG: hypothetical protein HKL95_04180 [Phycisphaerae bacterium]|nr:hypothetical protein [Phycisphaerae bacterium]
MLTMMNWKWPGGRGMILSLLWMLSLMGPVAGGANRTEATLPRKPISPQPSPAVSAALQMLQARGKTLHNFTANLKVTVHHLRTDEKDMNIGKIWYLRQGRATKFDIRFNMLVVDGAIARRHADHDIIFDGRWLIDRNGSAKIYRKIQLVGTKKDFNPLRLGRGPIPIPIGQRPSIVLREFHVSVIPNRMQAKGADAKVRLIHLRLVPRDKRAFAFVELNFWINPVLALPVKIERIDQDGTPTVAVLSKIKINQRMRHNFHVASPARGSGWTVDIEPLKPSSRVIDAK